MLKGIVAMVKNRRFNAETKLPFIYEMLQLYLSLIQQDLNKLKKKKKHKLSLSAILLTKSKTNKNILDSLPIC